MNVSNPESELLQQLQFAGLPMPAVEHRGIPGRRFRFDFAWPGLMIAAEVEGGTWNVGRHVTGSGYERDCEKYNAALLEGWRVYRFTTDMVRDGRALATLTEAIRRAQ